MDSACRVLDVSPVAYLPLAPAPAGAMPAFVGATSRSDRDDDTGVAVVVLDAGGGVSVSSLTASGGIGRALGGGGSGVGARLTASCALGPRAALLLVDGTLHVVAPTGSAAGAYGPPTPLAGALPPPDARGGGGGFGPLLACSVVPALADGAVARADTAHVVVGAASTAPGSGEGGAQTLFLLTVALPAGGGAPSVTAWAPLAVPPAAATAALGSGGAVAIVSSPPAAGGAAGVVLLALSDVAAGVVRVFAFRVSDGGAAGDGAVPLGGGLVAAPAGAAGSSGFRFGAALAAAGDVDGDGVGDLLVGAPGARGGAGAAYIVKLSGAGSATASAEVPPPPLGGGCAGGGFGGAVARVGDVNDDGVVDIAVACGGAAGDGGIFVVTLSCATCVRVVAADAAAAPAPGLSASDTLLVAFPCAVVPQPWAPASDGDIRGNVSFSAPLGRGMRGVWVTPSSLLIDLLDVSGASLEATRIGALTATLARGACGGGGGSTVVVGGSWGRHAAPVVLAAAARDFGGQPGIGSGDAIEVTFDRPVYAGGRDLSSRAAVDELLAFGAPLGADYVGALSADGTTLVVSIVDAAGAGDANATRVGRCAVTLRPGAGLLSVDRSSPPAAGGAVLGGSWGDFGTPVILSAEAADTGAGDGMGAGDSVRLRLAAPCNTPPLGSTEELRAAFQFAEDLGPGAWGVWERTTEAVVYVGAEGGARGDPGGTRIGALSVRVGPSLRPRDLSAPPALGPLVLVGGSWGNSIAAVAPTVLATTGSELVLLRLSAPLGRGADNLHVSATYGGGARSYSATQCAVDAAAGAYVQCLSAPGVGVGYTWVVSVVFLGGGGAGLVMSSPALTSYASPLIVHVAVGGGGAVVTDGGQAVTITGTGFGPEAAAVTHVTCWDKYNPAQLWFPTECRVSSQTTVVCRMPGVMGGGLVFALRIAGQPTADVSLPVAPPRLHNVTCGTCVAAAGSMSTAGGDTLVLRGVNLGPFVVGTTGSGGPSHAVSYAPAGAAPGAGFAALACAVTVPHHELTCTAAPGCGVALVFSVTVMGVICEAPLSSPIGYGAPVLSSVRSSGPAPAAGGSLLALEGANFAAACAADARYASMQVSVLLDGAPAPASAVAVVSDSALTVVLPGGVGSAHDVRVASGGGAGAASGALRWGYAAPSVESAGPINNVGGVWNVRVVGSNLGAWPALLNVSVGGAPCEVTALLPDALLCRTGAGGGAVRVCAGDQCSAPGGARFDPRQVLEPSALALAERDASVGAPLAGGGLVHLRGSALAPASPRVPVIMAWRRAPGEAWVDADDCPVAVALANRSAAAARSDFCATVGWVSSVLVDCALPSSDTGLAHVAVVNVIGDACIASAPVAVTYNPPTVTGVAPALLPTAGGLALVISGADFPLGVAVTIGGRACAGAVRVSARLISPCVSPRGEGASALLVLTAPGYAPAPQPLPLGFAPPSLTRVDAAAGPCVGGGLIALHGENFGAAPLVTVSGAAAGFVNVSADGRLVYVTAPPGSGARLVVGVTVGGQRAAAGDAAGGARYYSYAPPLVDGLGGGREYVDAARGGPVTLLGANFVPPGLNVSGLGVTISGVPCSEPARAADGSLSCVASPSRVDAAAAVVVVVSGVTGGGTVPVACPPGYSGPRPGDVCAVCPPGAVCYGRDLPPLPDAGYARVEGGAFVACVPPESCAALLPAVYRAHAGAAPLAAGGGGGPGASGGGDPGGPLDPAAAYENCVVGYAGAQCRSCAPDFYRRDVVCVPCPTLSSLYIALFFVFLVLVGALAGWLNRRQYNLKGARTRRRWGERSSHPRAAPLPRTPPTHSHSLPRSARAGLTIGIDYIQTLSMFHSFAFAWPRAVKALLEVSTVSTLAVELVAPECSVRFTFAQVRGRSARVLACAVCR